jgi:adenine-specific DNA-methyltransferase
MDKLKMHTPDKVDVNVEKIAALFPNCVTEKIIGYKDEIRSDGTREPIMQYSIDFDVLRQELSDVVVDGPQERYQFTWPDKRKSILMANQPVAKTMRPCREESVNFDTTQNLYIEGDNLDALKLLQETYLGKVKMIYIDPPYNTGNDFIYDDDFAQSSDEYMASSGQFDMDGGRLVTNLESNGRFHTDWLNMIYPRLKLAKDLLTDDGVIFISIDDNEVENLKKICGEVFGHQNFIAQISSLNNPKGRSQDKYVATCHEYLLIFSKTQLIKGAVSIPKTAEEIKKDYPLRDKNGLYYRELELRNTHRDFGKFNRPKLYYPIYVSDDGHVSLAYTNDYHEVLPNWDDGFEGCWTWGKEKAKNEIEKLVGKYVLGQWKIYRMAYALQDMEEPMKQVKSIWLEKLFHTEKGQASVNDLFGTKEKYFQSPKSVDYIAQCIQMSQQRDAVVLDFFSGTATTAQAVMQLNAEDGGHRKFIMVQLPEETDEKSEAYKAGYKNICEIGKERIRRAGQKIKDESGLMAQNLDIGFRVLKIDSTNMQDVYYSPSEIQQTGLFALADNIKPNRSSEDLLFQIMLDLGILLSSTIEEKAIGGKKVFSVADGYLIACFDSDVTTEAVTEIAKMKPYYAVFRDSGMASDSVATNFEQIFATYSPSTVRKVI